MSKYVDILYQVRAINLDSSEITVRYTTSPVVPVVTLQGYSQSTFLLLDSGANNIQLNSTSTAVTLGDRAVYTLAITQGQLLQFAPDSFDVQHDDQASNVRPSMLSL